uniref:7TM GPCR serpentine receptor class x (Srx) domain-containing protein n=1 Tax=Panagrolaimus sp. PS1159 TaxID=55785 RepID=A0AC35ERG4_9BILA
MYWSWYFVYQGICQILGYSLFGELGNTIIASIAQYLFYVCMNMNLLFAFNRFSAVVYGHKHETIFSTFNGLLYIALIYLGSAIMNIPSFMFLVKYYPELGTYNYLYMPSVDFLKASIYIEMATGYAIHLAIFVLKMKSLTVQHKKEQRLLIQAVLSGSPCFVFMTVHQLIHFPLLEVLAAEMCVAVDKIVYMWFNKEIRADVLEAVGIKSIFKHFGSTSVYTTSTNAATVPVNP